MKKVLSIILVLVMVLAFVGCGQETAQSKEAMLKGSYSTEGAALGLNLVFDEKGHFCLYSQSEGLLEEGNYIQQDENLYVLECVPNKNASTSNNSSVIIASDGLYHISDENAYENTSSYKISFFKKYSEDLNFVGNWANEWDHFPEGEYSPELTDTDKR